MISRICLDSTHMLEKFDDRYYHRHRLAYINCHIHITVARITANRKLLEPKVEKSVNSYYFL